MSISTRPTWWQSARRVWLTLLLLYLGVLLAVYLGQRRLIYQPTKLTPGSAGGQAAQQGFQPWKNPAGAGIGWRIPAAAPGRGSVLIVHGNAGWAGNRRYLAMPIHEAEPVDVFVLEYPGYGERAGTPDERSFLAAAEEAFALLTHRGPVYVVSESLGAGVAAHLARKHPHQVAGLAMFAPYDNLAAVAQRQMPFVPAGWLLRDRFDPAEWLKEYRGPVVVVVAGKDRIIPPARGRVLHAGYAGPKRLQVIPDAGHNDISTQSPEWWRETFSFWRRPQ